MKPERSTLIRGRERMRSVFLIICFADIHAKEQTSNPSGSMRGSMAEPLAERFSNRVYEAWSLRHAGLMDSTTMAKRHPVARLTHGIPSATSSVSRFPMPAPHFTSSHMLSVPSLPLFTPRFSAPVMPRRKVPSAKGNIFQQIGKAFGVDRAARTRKQWDPMVAKVNAMDAEMRAKSDDELRDFTQALRKRAMAGESTESLMAEAFAVVREAGDRVLGLRAFDVQLIGGAVLNSGAIAEMGTGEGKTLVAVLPAFLNALSGKGAHVVTVNDYLARRDAEWVGQVHRFLGLKVGLIQAEMDNEQRRKAYQCDVTYVTNSELGFDYLRDGLALTPPELVLRPFNYAVLDEADSILIDEARTPLIISGQGDKPSDRYTKANKIANAMVKDVHYDVDEKRKQISLTEEGFEAAEEILQVSDLYNPSDQWALYLINALKAKELQILDKSYIVKDGQIMIVDEFTGRVMEGRRWSDGLHQAVEAKEGLAIQKESMTLASISYQNFFLNYPKMSGMTGTALTESQEFENIYKLPVVIVPPNRERIREDNEDVVFKSTDAKWKAVCIEIERMNRRGRPVLVGTTSVELSEMLSEQLKEVGVPHELLNAKPENVQRESEIVAQGGRKGAVTIATNMAGRGTDILLGGNPEYMARLMLRSMLMPEVVKPGLDDVAVKPKKGFGKQDSAAAPITKWSVNPKLFPCDLSDATTSQAREAVKQAVAEWGARNLTELDAEDRLSVACERASTQDPVTLALRTAFNAMMDEYGKITSQEKAEVQQLGGLHVIGTELHESRRIDNQLRGRSGRQGDPGSTRYFLSLDDNIFRIFGGDKIKKMMSTFGVDDLPIESGMLTNALDNAQTKVEAYFFDIRKNLFEYDEVLNKQRGKVYADRLIALTADNSTVMETMLEYAAKTVEDILRANVPDPGKVPDQSWDNLVEVLSQYCAYFGNKLTADDLRSLYTQSGYNAVYERLTSLGREAVEKKAEVVDSLQEGLMVTACRYFLLTQTDNGWKQQLEQLKFVQQGIGLRGYGQRDPLTEYKLESFKLYQQMQSQIRRNVIYSAYNFEPMKTGQTR
eukprot:gnl/MRDRNA2_/MRDRNA2_150043_c0_seq1.p1 gnl/MRDRNA2_/MRDRNA2_150043_c0~~gnl/MRDRNA2_/MRDRNA2_150043_c0_seq1.p1  ORF type:complete len:1073 (+),score=207.09 gnl/MRDRNA2_/MRDRNA2_150043_c0_seq1:26-3220(+)